MCENQCPDRFHWEPRLVSIKAEEYGIKITEQWASVVEHGLRWKGVVSSFVYALLVRLRLIL